LLESEREARSAAERAARSRDEFLALVSHELRTPLNGILGWAQYLSEYFKKHRPDAAVSDGVDAIERGGRALAKLIEDLLDMNRITSGRLALDVSAVHLYGVVEPAVATMRPAAESKQIALHAVLDSKMGPVIGDPARLQQVVWNLVSNAVKFTPKGGVVNVVLRRADSHAEICIHDTGMGVSAEFLPHVFDRFRQADSSITRAHGGLGLGLAIVKHLVELHGGTVNAESAGEGKGATFVVRLPLAAVRNESSTADADATLESAHGEVDLAGVTVLVVDDDAEARELIRRVLDQAKATVFTAAGAADALDVLAREKLDVLVSDIGMPTIDGYQFIRTVREQLNVDGSELPAIAVTAYARSQDRTRAMLAGYQMHIAKPIEPQELLATVASFAGRTSVREPA
jgi:CheY-like chemotaxis protein